MPVEHRSSNRHPVDFEVEIRYRGRRFPSARAGNLSLQGMYVETRKITLPKGTLLELEIKRRGLEWLIPAIVVHGDSRGVGLMFREIQPKLYDQEIGVLAAAPHRCRISATQANRAGP